VAVDVSGGKWRRGLGPFQGRRNQRAPSCPSATVLAFFGMGSGIKKGFADSFDSIVLVERSVAGPGWAGTAQPQGKRSGSRPWPSASDAGGTGGWGLGQLSRQLLRLALSDFRRRLGVVGRRIRSIR